MFRFQLRHSIIATKKFFQILQEGNPRIVPQLIGDVIISKHLRSIPRPPLPPSKITPDYNAYQNGSPLGSIIDLQFKGIQLNLVSMNPLQTSAKSILQLLLHFKPTLILVQTPPELYIPHFTLLPKTPSDNTFSDIAYYNQLFIDPKYVPNEQRKAIINNLQRGVPLTDDLAWQKLLLVSSHYAQLSNCKLMLSDMPLQPYREWICNTHTLKELQQVLRRTGIQLPNYNYADKQPIKLSKLLFPDCFLKVSDGYGATLIEMAVAQQQPRVLVLGGLMSNEAIESYLEKGLALKPIVEWLVPPKHRDSLLRSIPCWQILQKHILLDTLSYGKEIMHMKLGQLSSTTAMMNHYGQKIGGYSQEAMLQFRYDMTMKYLSLMDEAKEEGAVVREKIMMREVLRSTKY